MKRKLDRKVFVRDAKYIVIASEGEHPEKRYFDMIAREFRNPRVCVEIIPSTGGRSAPNHVLQNLDEIMRDEKYNKDHDEFWLMVDRDQWPSRNLAQVTRGAVQRKVNLAISNPCFELWLYLHFDTLKKTSLRCSDIEKMLRKIAAGYNKTRLNADKCKGKVRDAIRRAQALDKNPDERWPRQAGTHVYKVVKKCLPDS